MMVVTVEVWPGGYEAGRHQVGQLVLYRQPGGSGGFNSYCGVLADDRGDLNAEWAAAHPLDALNGGQRRTVSHRYSDGFWPLIAAFAKQYPVPSQDETVSVTGA